MNAKEGWIGGWTVAEDLNSMFRGKVIAKVAVREGEELKLVFTDGTAMDLFPETDGSLGYAELPEEDYPEGNPVALRIDGLIQNELKKARRTEDAAITKGLVRPYSLRLPTAWASVKQFWIVFDERQPGGYQIVYGAGEAKFGLATSGTVLGFYGSFLATFDAM